ncbi:MAG: hypothetical protein HGA85_01660 [Nanoarchaeota archaeon]|nr:hypothetical protein [Nanoarchaeota archaeon]
MSPDLAIYVGIEFSEDYEKRYRMDRRVTELFPAIRSGCMHADYHYPHSDRIYFHSELKKEVEGRAVLLAGSWLEQCVANASSHLLIKGAERIIIDPRQVVPYFPGVERNPEKKANAIIDYCYAAWHGAQRFVRFEVQKEGSAIIIMNNGSGDINWYQESIRTRGISGLVTLGRRPYSSHKFYN